MGASIKICYVMLCLRAKVVVIGQKWLYSGEKGSNRVKVVVFEQK